MPKKNKIYISVIIAAVLLVGILSIVASFLGEPVLPSNDRKADISAKATDPELFLRDIDFNDGGDYILVIQVDGVETIIAQNSVLESYQDKIRVGGLNWLMFVPGERGRPDKSIVLYKDGERLRHSSSYTSKSFAFSNIIEHGITVKYKSFYESREATEARITKLELPDRPRVFIIDKPALYKKYNTILILNLPSFWTSPAIKLADIKANLSALTDEYITPHITTENVTMTVKELDGVRIQDNRGIDLVDENGDPVTLDDVLSYYSPRLKISCDHIEQCQALRPKLTAVFRAVKSWRDNELLDSIEHPMLPERDKNGDRAIHLGITLHDEFWAEISENKYSLSYYETVE